MTTPCPDVNGLLPEFALGLLGGDERAVVVEHLGTCASCRDQVASLVSTADDVIGALADADPPAGFEGRVFARFDGATPLPAPAGGPGGRRSRLVLLGIAAALVLVVGAAVVATLVVDRATTPRPVASARTAPMRTPVGATVGQASISGHPAAVLLVAPRWTRGESGTYRLRVVLRSGTIRDRGQVVFDDGYAAYGVPGVAAGEIRRIEMIGTDGKVACSADFS